MAWEAWQRGKNRARVGSLLITPQPNSDAHAPGQLDFLDHGSLRAAVHEVPLERVVNTWPLDDLLAWTEG